MAASTECQAEIKTSVYLQGLTLEAVVYHLTRSGCMMELDSKHVQVDDRLKVLLAGEQRPAYVEWLREPSVGITFYRKISAGTVKKLGFEPSETEFSRLQPRLRRASKANVPVGFVPGTSGA